MMSDQPAQNFDNHIRRPDSLIVVALVYLVALILAIVGIVTSKVFFATIAIAIACVAGILGLLMARIYATTLQDRIIRLEMRVRMRQVLPDELAADILDFSLAQLLGLRFASDDELPELARKVLDENITSSKEVKKLVREWQPDHHRV